MQAKHKSTPLLACPVFMLAGVWRYLSVVAQVHAIFFTTSFLDLKGKISNFMQILNGNSDTMIDLFLSAKKTVIFSAPGISEVIAEVLIRMKEQNGIKILVYVEFNEGTFRQGFGEISAITKLRNKGIEFFSKVGLNVNFIIVDDKGYFYFPKSLFIEQEGTCKDLFEMTARQVKELKLLCNALSNEDPEFEQIYDSIGDDIVIEIASNIKRVDEEKSKSLEIIVKNDLPIKPDFGRKLEIYRAKFQFVELKFTGANLHTTKVKLPRHSMPFKDAKLNKTIEASLRILDDISEKEFLKPFFDLKNDMDSIRTKYFHYIKSREKNIINRTDKATLNEELNPIQKRIEEIKVTLINQLQKEIQNSRRRVKDNLLAFLVENKPEGFENLYDDTLRDEIENYSNKIIGSIHFPRATSLLKALKIDLHFYDITWQDLHNNEVLEEMLKHGLIDESEKAYIDEKAIGATDIK